MTHRSATVTVLAAALALTAAVLGPSAAAQDGDPAAGAGAGSAMLDLESQTLFVDDEPAEISLRLVDAPADARLRFTIYSRGARNRADVRAQHDEPPTSGSRIANFECTLDGDCRDQATMTVGRDGTIRVVLDDTEIGESLRRPGGAKPFVVQLLAGDDETVLDELATSLLVLDDEAGVNGPGGVHLAFTDGIIAPLGRRADLETVVDPAAVLAAADALAAHPDLPVTAEIRPETLDALAATDPDAFDELVGLLDDHPVLRSPWVDMDEEAWRVVGEADQVLSQYALGDRVLEQHLGVASTGVVRLDPDAGPETLSLLRSAGATTVLVADDRLAATPAPPEPTQPFRLLDANGVAITALRYDEALHTTLADADPELAAAHAVAELAVLADTATTDLAVLLDLDRLHPDARDALLAGIDATDGVRVVEVEDLAALPPARVDGEPLRGELRPTPAPDVAPLAQDLESATLGLATIARMIEPEVDLLTPYVTQLQAAVSADLTPDEASRFVDSVTREIAARRSGIEIPDGDRITLTDRRTELRLTILNRQALPLNVELLLTAEKIRFPDGDRHTMVLQPGVNVVPIEVETLASGDARLTATVVSPGGFYELGSGTVDIRSTAISGLGLIISIIALLVLAVWWIRTIRRVRRNRGAATVSAESEAGASAADVQPTEGES